MLETRGLSRSFGGLRAVADVSLAVKAGNALGVIGPNGAGKSTLLNLIAGQLRPSTGSVLIDGRDVTGARPWVIARAGVARTFQVVRGFRGLTVRENVAIGAMFGHKTSVRQATMRADDVLERVGLAGQADAVPDELSVAQARGLELARALALRPRVLLLDEIMAGLRHTEITAVLELLRSLKCEGIAIVAVEHVMKAILSIADEVLVLHEGSELARGAPAGVVADPRVVEAYLGQRYARRGRDA